MNFIDLTQSAEFDPETHIPCIVKTVDHARVKDHPDNFRWRLVIEAAIGKDQALPELPAAFAPYRAAMLGAMEGGIQVQNQFKKFHRKGALSIMPIRDGEPVIEGQAAALDKCAVHLVELMASEDKASIRYHVTVVTDSSKAQEWVELEQRDVWLKFELGEGNPQLELFDRKRPALAVVDGGGDPKPPARKKTRRGGARRKPAAAEATA